MSQGGRLPTIEEVRLTIANKLGIDTSDRATIEKSKNGHLLDNEQWVPIGGGTRVRDWAQIGLSADHFPGRSHVLDIKKYPVWGDDATKMTVNTNIIIFDPAPADQLDTRTRRFQIYFNMPDAHFARAEKQWSDYDRSLLEYNLDARGEEERAKREVERKMA